MTTKNSIRASTTGKGAFGNVPFAAKSKKSINNDQQHQPTFSASINDMKSLLPSYDEVSSFVKKYGRETAKTGGAIPKPGRSIKKLNIEDLPRKYSSNTPLIPEKGKVLKPKSRGKISGEYDLISKFDTTVFTPDSKLTQEMASKLKLDFKNKKESKTSLKSDNSKDFSKLSSKIMNGIENDLGFGFRSSLDANAVQKNFRNEKSYNSQQAMKTAARKTETSIQALKKKINNKRDQWNHEKFGWDGYHYKEPEGVIAKQLLTESSSPVSKAPPNEKLTEMSRSFRKSLNINTDMRKAIKTPKNSLLSSQYPSGDNKTTHGRSDSSDSAGSPDEDGLELDNPCKNVQLNRPGFQFPNKKPPSLKAEGNVKSSGQSQTELMASRRRSNKDLAGVMKLQTLLESHSKESLYDIHGNKIDDTELDIPYKKFDFGDLKQATNSLVNSFPKPRVSKTETMAQTSPHPTSSKDEIQVLSENFYSPRPRGAKEKTEAQDLIKQRLGESVKNVDDAATIASRLGSLMTRVAMCKKVEGKSKVQVDTVSLARELRELASSMEKDYGVGASGAALQTSDSVETQTDHQQQKSLPQPKFTKQMSYTDQLVLRKLREVRQLWTKGIDETPSSEDL